MGPVRGCIFTLDGGSMYNIGARWFDKKETQAICDGKQPYISDDGTELFWDGDCWSSRSCGDRESK